MPHAVAFQAEKNPSVGAFLAWSVPHGINMPFHTTATIDLACPRCLEPPLSKTTGLAVYRIGSPTMLSAVIGQDCWGLLDIRIACLQCQCPCGVTATWLPEKKISTLPAFLWLLAMTVAGLLFDGCFDCCAAVPLTPFCTTVINDSLPVMSAPLWHDRPFAHF